MGNILNGKEAAKQVKAGLEIEIQKLKEKNIIPGLAAVLIGNNPASEIYVSSKAKQCEKIGIHSEVIRDSDDITHEKLIALVEELNHRNDIHGILVQEPLPPQIDNLDLKLRINPLKDVDGFHPQNLGRILIGQPLYLTCTPFGILEILRQNNLSLLKKDVVIIGRSNIVGKPLAAMIMQKWPDTNGTVTVCHTGTRDIAAHTKNADVVVCAMGIANYLKADMIKEGAIIIDVGINRIDDPDAKKGYRVVGDVDFDSCLEKSSWITPVPGGIGLMTTAMLLYNTVKACKIINHVE